MKPSLLYFVAEDWYFCSHRLQLACAARSSGFEVSVVTNVSRHAEEIKAAGIQLYPLEFARRGRNPLREILVFAKLCAILLRVRPDVVHNVALKPVLYGTLAARLCGVENIVNTLAGLGHLFSAGSRRVGAFRRVVEVLLRVLCKSRRVRLILQNPDDVEVICGKQIAGWQQVRLIRGSGVDTDEYHYVPEPASTPVVLFASRLLWSKGLGEFVAAARALRGAGVRARFVVVGMEDDQNPRSIPLTRLKEWEQEGNIEWYGHRSDMPHVLAGAHIVCLPTTYGEGVPKILIEAAACGRPIVATDVPGCREIVNDGRNGLLVPPGNATALTDGLRILIENADLRTKMGLEGRALACTGFSIQKVNAETLDVYHESHSQRASV